MAIRSLGQKMHQQEISSYNLQQKTTKRHTFYHQRMIASCICFTLVLLNACTVPVATSTPTAITEVPTSKPTINNSTPVVTPSPGVTPAGWESWESENWSGYTFPKGNVTGVQAEWTEPDISNVANAHVATWVGIGGWGDSYNNIVQIGTLAHVTPDGQIQHTVWYETLPPNSWIWIGTISAGDAIFASIELKHGSTQQWDMLLIDKTTGQRFPVSVVFQSQRIYSDFVVEDPDATSNNGPPFFPFPQFAPITFHHASIRYTQNWLPISAIYGIQVTLTQSGKIIAVPGPLAYDSFTITHSSG